MNNPGLVFLLFVWPAAVWAEHCLEYDQPGTVLAGSLVRLHFNAKNSDGEIVPQSYWQLRRIEPFCVDPGESSHGNIRMQGASIVELWPPSDSESDLEGLDGERIEVRGRIVPTFMPHYHSELIFSADSVRRLESEE